MNRNLCIGVILFVVAGIGIGLVVMLPYFYREENPNKTIQPKPEPVAKMPTPKENSSSSARDEKTDVKSPASTKKTDEEPKPYPSGKSSGVRPDKSYPEPDIKKKDETPPDIKKKDDVPPDIKKKDETPPDVKKKDDVKPDVKVIAKKEDKKAKVIEFFPLTQLNDPDGEYTVKPLYRGTAIEISGTIKTLKIRDLAEKSSIDASKLTADEVVFMGGIYSGSKVILGKARSIKIRDINEKSELDASMAEAREVIMAGSLNSGGVLKLHAPQGKIEFVNQVNDRSTVEIVAPEGKIVFKSTGATFNSNSTLKVTAPKGTVEIAGQVNFSKLDIAAPEGKVALATINAESQITVAAKDVEVNGPIFGNQTQITVTLSREGSLKFKSVNAEARLFWCKSEASDPAPRIEPGTIGARAQFKEMPAGKK